MGLFGFGKKKKSKPEISFSIEETISKPSMTASKATAPSTNYQIAALLNWGQSGKPIGQTVEDYSRNLSYQYGISDPIAFHKEVIRDGYLIEGSPKDNLSKLKVAELKEILNKHSLPSTGKKADLIQRILDSVDATTLGIKPIYVLSPKGKAHLDEYAYIFSFQRYGISFEEFDAGKRAYPNLSNPNDIVFRILNDRYNRHNTERSFGLARNDVLCMSYLLADEQHYEDGLFHLIVVLYYDLSGLGNNNLLAEFEDVIVPPGIASLLQKYSCYFDAAMVGRCCERYALPHHYFTKAQFARCLNDIFEDALQPLTEYVR